MGSETVEEAVEEDDTAAVIDSEGITGVEWEGGEMGDSALDSGGVMGVDSGDADVSIVLATVSERVPSEEEGASGTGRSTGLDVGVCSLTGRSGADGGGLSSSIS